MSAQNSVMKGRLISVRGRHKDRELTRPGVEILALLGFPKHGPGFLVAPGSYLGTLSLFQSWYIK